MATDDPGRVGNGAEAMGTESRGHNSECTGISDESGVSEDESGVSEDESGASEDESGVSENGPRRLEDEICGSEGESRAATLEAEQVGDISPGPASVPLRPEQAGASPTTHAPAL